MQCRISAADAIEQFFCGHPPYLGQLLTDFGNGQHFKSLLQNAGFEGYVFMEQYASNTYCIFDSNKISLPMHHVFIPEDEIGDLLLAYYLCKTIKYVIFSLCNFLSIIVFLQ